MIRGPRRIVQQNGEDEARSELGILSMIAAMIVIPFVDGIAKYLSTDYSPLFIISWARYAVASSIVLPLAWMRLRQNMFSRQGLVAQTIRTVLLITAMTLYFIAISKIQLTLALSAYFVGPIITLLLSILFLKEQVTLRKGLALVLGFVGMLVILRPDGVKWIQVSFLHLERVSFFALYLIVTRVAASGSNPLQALAFQCALWDDLAVSTGGVILEHPQLPHLWLFLGLGMLSALGHALSIIAFRFAEASTLAPLVYVEILVTTLVGYLVFSEIPDRYTVLGGCLIVAGGLVTLKNFVNNKERN